jgi:hypothetical protein
MWPMWLSSCRGTATDPAAKLASATTPSWLTLHVQLSCR